MNNMYYYWYFFIGIWFALAVVIVGPSKESKPVSRFSTVVAYIAMFIWILFVWPLIPTLYLVRNQEEL